MPERFDAALYLMDLKQICLMFNSCYFQDGDHKTTFCSFSLKVLKTMSTWPYFLSALTLSTTIIKKSIYLLKARKGHWLTSYISYYEDALSRRLTLVNIILEWRKLLISNLQNNFTSGCSSWRVVFINWTLSIHT